MLTLMLPGKSLFSPDIPDAPPPVMRDDPGIAAAKKKTAAAEKNRKGRRSTIQTSGLGVTGSAPLAQPRARAAQLLGG